MIYMAVNMQIYKLSEFAEKLNVSTKTLQRWDKSGVLVAYRNENNRRYYTSDHIAQYEKMVASNAVTLTRIKNYKYEDLSGRTFGQLYVIDRADDWIGKNGHRQIQWNCECQACGKLCVIKGSGLKAGYNKSCGCSQYGDSETKAMWEQYIQLRQDYETSGIVPKSHKRVQRERKSLQNVRFGWLEVICTAPDQISSKGKPVVMWHCRCDCGTELDVSASNLRAGNAVSCGCMPEEQARQLKPVIKSQYRQKCNLKNGDKFGFWKVIEESEPKIYKGGGRARRFLCECKCGTQKIVPARDLISGASQSCGCMKSASWLEYYVRQYLDEHGYTYDYQKKYDDLIGTGGKPLSYDFLVYKNNVPLMFIECQGEQHYRPIKKFGGSEQLIIQKIHDKLKRNYAEQVCKIPVNEILYMCTTYESVVKTLSGFGL